MHDLLASCCLQVIVCASSSLNSHCGCFHLYNADFVWHCLYVRAYSLFWLTRYGMKACASENLHSQSPYNSCDSDPPYTAFWSTTYNRVSFHITMQHIHTCHAKSWVAYLKSTLLGGRLTDWNEPDDRNWGYAGAELSEIEKYSNIVSIMIMPRTGRQGLAVSQLRSATLFFTAQISCHWNAWVLACVNTSVLP